MPEKAATINVARHQPDISHVFGFFIAEGLGAAPRSS
jgi:hypothetical protein